MKLSKNEILYKNTYASLCNRVHENGYAPTSMTGAYPGMFVRDASVQVMAHIANKDFELTKRILRYMLDYHRKYDFKFAIHVLDNDRPMISDRNQADTTFFLTHAWCLYAINAPQSAEKDEFLASTADLIKRFISYWFDTGCYNEETGLLRNPCFEHSRDGSYFNGYDLLTNVYLSQSLHEMGTYYKKYDKDFASWCSQTADKTAQGIHKNLTSVVDGTVIYSEMQAISKERGCDSVFSDDDNYYVGFSGFQFTPMGALWYAADKQILENTYNATLKYGSSVYFEKYQMVDGYTTFICDGKCDRNGVGHILGKGLAWELMYCHDTGKSERKAEIVELIENYSNDMYRETWTPDGGGSDTANQEHAAWMIYGMKHVFPELGCK